MKKHLYSLFGLIVSCIPLFGQNCGTSSPTDADELFFGKFIHKHAKSKNTRAGAVPLKYVPVKVHIIRNDDGSGGVDLIALNAKFAELNRAFLPVGLQFYFGGSGSFGGTNPATDSPHFINSTTYNTTINYSNANTFTGILSAYNVSNAINLYISSTIIGAEGFATQPNASFNHVFVNYLAISNAVNKTLLHEFGHYFGLYHTFQDSNHATVSNREVVTRGLGANCSTRGDRVCDTPADPYEQLNSTQRNNVNNACSYALTTPIDANGVSYQPSITNVMSYWSRICGLNQHGQLTPGQYERMKIGYIARTDPSNQYTLDCAPVNQPLPGLPTAVMGVNGIILQWTDNSTTETGYFVERAESTNAQYICLGGVGPGTNTYIDSEFSAGRTYHYRIRASNTTDFSGIVSITVPQNQTSYCFPVYTNQVCTLVSSFITKVKINGTALDNTSDFPSPCNANNFSDFTAIPPAALIAGQSYTFILKGSTSQHYAIWIDANQNGTFETPEMIAKSTTSSEMIGTTEKSVLVTLPTTLLNGPTRMRVRTADFASGGVTNACSRYTVGETEDYTVTISNGSSLPQIQLLSTFPPLCASGNYQASFTTSGSFSGNNTFKAELSDTYGNFAAGTEVGNGTSSPLTVSLPPLLAPGSYYRLRIISTDISVSTNSESIQVYSKPEASIAVSGNAVVCAPTTVSLTAAAGEGYTYTWKNNAGTLPSATNQTLAAAQTENYRVEISQNGCINESGPVAVTINPKVQVNLSGAASIYASQSANLSVSLIMGTLPYQLTLSTGQQFTNSMNNPFTISVSPTTTTTYTITQVSNTQCGAGTATGSALITVLPTQFPCPQTLAVHASLPAPYQASETITTTGTIQYTSGNITYTAGKSITITSPANGGFWQSGPNTVFEAKITGCQ
ncbi:hypothetical protein GVN20_07080 [Runella sp. CRIBMP]|uniref:GEVED domain-containing protein n=1 Tax=Runella sp. CRIBMP TaxID=2683261 RepID=UPI001412D2B3|nr:GEVED domain-containing protein [Runella sp. CRIBMP]NBB19112.1 hypothetical protein [Runella sp. CRIBMP]